MGFDGIDSPGDDQYLEQVSLRCPHGLTAANAPEELGFEDKEGYNQRSSDPGHCYAQGAGVGVETGGTKSGRKGPHR